MRVRLFTRTGKWLLRGELEQGVTARDLFAAMQRGEVCVDPIDDQADVAPPPPAEAPKRAAPPPRARTSA